LVAASVAKRLDRLNGANSSGIAFQKLWQRNCELIEAQFNDLFQALAVGKEIMPTLPAVTINADYTGAVMPSNQLPKTILCTRFNGTTDVTALVDLERRGKDRRGNGDHQQRDRRIAAHRDYRKRYCGRDQRSRRGRRLDDADTAAAVPFRPAAAPTGGGGGGGGGGSTESTSIFADINSTSHAEVCALTVTAGSGGVVTLAAPLYVTTAEALPVGALKVYGKWQWDSTGGGVWVDLAAEVSSSPIAMWPSVANTSS
jgi:hypothetical protein